MLVDEQHFERVASAVLELRSSEALRLLVEEPGPPLAGPFARGVRFVVRGQDPRVEEYFSSEGFTYGEFRQGLGDLADAITAVMTNIPLEGFVGARQDEQRNPHGETEPEERSRSKYELVEREFPVEELRQRYWLKRTTKNEVQQTVDWEISTKVQDDDTETPEGAPVPYAVVRFETGPSSQLAQLFTGRAPNALVLTMDSEDLGYILDSLGRLRDELQRQEEEQRS